MDQYEAVHRLVDKIQTALPEIRIRSITSLHTKITVGILDYQLLPKFKKMPGALLNWINDNSSRSENLFKVLTILSYFAKTQEGLVLLQQYEATQFFKQLRQFLLSQNAKSDQYTNILENMIKSLLPLHPQTSIGSEESASNIPLEQSKIQEKVDNKKSTQSVRKDERQRGGEVRLTWTVSKDPLGKKEEDELYSLFMELRHGKRQLHLELLKRIHQLVKYWGYKWFRFRGDLVNELIDQYPKSTLKWLIIEIIRSILKGLNLNSRQLKSGQLDLINVNSPKLISKPQSQLVTISMRSELFHIVYSANLLKDILSYQFQPNQQAQIEEWIVYLSFKFSSKYFIQAFSRLIKRERRQLNLTVLNRQIQFYFDNYPQSRSNICSLVQQIPQEWGLRPEDFPVMMNFLHQTQKSKAYAFISRYDGEWQPGSNLHIMSDVMVNLEKGINGVGHTAKKSQLIRMYIKCLLTLGIAVEKQDPLMTYYPKMKNLIMEISQNVDVRTVFYQEILSAINSHSKIRYGSAAFISSEIAMMVFGEDSLFKKLFEQALNQEQACGCWLEVTKRLVLTNNLGTLDEFTVLFYSLSSHKNQQIKEISKFLLQKLSKAGKMHLHLCRLFSTSEQERRKIASQLFKSNSQTILRELDGSPPEKWKSGAKKLLKIGAQTLENYIKIIFNNNLEEHIQISAAQQLLESIERIELNETIVSILIDVSESIRDVLNKVIDRQRSNVVSVLVQVRELINQRTKHQNMLKLPLLINLLSEERHPKSIKILLREIYVQVFQSPFHTTSQLHFTILLNPPLKLLSIPLAQSSQSHQVNVSLPPSKATQLDFANYRESRQLQHFAEWAIHQIINNQSITLDQAFAEIVEKEIGQIIHASKGYVHLHFLLYVFQALAQNQIDISDKISEYSAPLLNSLLAKQIPPMHSEATAQLLKIIGSRRNRQLTNLLSNGGPGTWKLYLVSTLANLDPEIIQQCLKGLLGLHYGRESALILKSLLPHLKTTEVNKFSQSLIVTSCLKYFRQDGDHHLRKIALCVLTELYGEVNLPAQGDAQLFASLTAVITEQVVPSQVMALALNLAKLVIQKDSKVIAQGTVLKLLLSRLTLLSSTQTTFKIVQATVLQLFRVIVSLGREDLLAGIDLIDLSLPLFSLIQKLPVLSDGQMRLLIAGLDILYFSCESQPDLPKYILTSTRLQSQLLQALQIPVQGEGVSDFLEAISRLWIRVSTIQQDLFVYKISQLLVDSSQTLMRILATHLQKGGIQFLKMLGWTVIIWSKNRQLLDDQLGQQFAHALLASPQPHLIKLLMPFSLNAKHTFLSSPLLIDSLKEANSIIESRIVKDTKEKKKKGKPYPLPQKEAQALVKIFGYLSALFYWSGQGLIEGGEGLRRIIGMLQHFYLSGTWQQEVMKHFLRVITNMGLSAPLSDSIAARLSQNGALVQEIANTILRVESIDRTSRIGLRLAASLVHIESVRTQLLRARIIEQLSNKLIRGEQRQQLNLEYALEAVELLLTFSAYKDSNIRILGDKRVAEVLIRLLMAGKLSILQEKIVKLLANLACFKHNKPTLMSCKDLHKAILGLLEDSQTPYRSSLLFLLYNLLYKNSAGLKLYRRPEVIDLIRSIQVNESQEVEAIGSALLQALEGCEG